MAISKIQSESINLADTFAFTGTVTGAGEIINHIFKPYQRHLVHNLLVQVLGQKFNFKYRNC